MFTAAQIAAALSAVKTGADFPRAAMQLKKLGITRYETRMEDGQSVFYGAGGHQVHTGAAYAPIPVADEVNAGQLVSDIRSHQQGRSDYFQISRQSAAGGVAKWAVDLEQMTCSYIDKAGKAVWVEHIPATGYGQVPFTVAQIGLAHSRVKSGADFPRYIREIKALGVTAFETGVKDSHTEYFGAGGYRTASAPMYEDLAIAGNSNKAQFEQYLNMHQRGQTDYTTFCRHCAQTGIEKWYVSLEKMTCTYYDKAGAEVLTEQIPQ